MPATTDLIGARILIVEDNYFLAVETAAALRDVGAEIIGPCPSESAARDLLERAAPTRAILDINLGDGGPRFAVARLLKARGVPFLFLTGYDSDVIPPDLAQAPRLQKPASSESLIDAVKRL